MQLTPAQHQAIHDHQHNLIVTAGAGSGKTFVLVERYLALLDAHPEWPLNALVAITFTRKAAQEMRDRVRQALEQRYQSAGNAAARDLWAERLRTMDSARIDTIHGLCASILRANAAAIGIDPGFEVLDEVQARLWLEDAVDLTLGQISESGDPALDLLAEFSPQQVRSALLELSLADIPDLPPDLFAHWQADWELEAAHALNRLRDNPLYRAAVEWQPPPEETPGADKLSENWLNCQEWARILDGVADLGARLAALTEISRLRMPGATKRAAMKQTVQQLRDLAKATLELIGEPPDEIDHRSADRIPLWGALTQQVQTAYATAKQTEGVLDFNDLERLTRQLLEIHPSVRARYQGTAFQHILVDEFQDTNAAQWAIIDGLIRLEQGGSLFVVGDPKQSIYQFRGADVRVFEQVRDRILDYGGQSVALSDSFRSHQGLAECFNHLFERILVRDPASPVAAYEVEHGQPMRANRQNAPSPAPPIELLLIGESNEEPKANAETRRRVEAAALAQRLREIVEVEKRPVYDRRGGPTRPIGWGDIAVLFQSTAAITLYEDAFKAAGLPFVTIAGRGYYSRQEVWDLLNLLSALHNPADDLALASALRSPLFGLSDDALLALRLERDGSGGRLPLWMALDQAAPVLSEADAARTSFARECLRELRGLAGRITIADLLREIFRQTGILAVLTGLPDGARRRGNVEKLLQQAEASGEVMLGAFTRALLDLSSREVREGEALTEIQAAVTLMTVHASKGLEFPLVALANTDWRRGSSSTPPAFCDPTYGLVCKVLMPDSGQIKAGYACGRSVRLAHLREQAERKRLLYVAATRAQDYLLISAAATPKANRRADPTWIEQIAQALDIQPETLETGDQQLDGFPWGSLPIRVVIATADQQAAPDAETLWDHPAVQRGEPLSDTILAPPLLAAVPIERGRLAHHLSATQIADLGSAAQSDAHARRLRRSLLHDAPDHVAVITRRDPNRVSDRIIGEIVHKVLGRPNLPDSQRLDDILAKYAWEQGVIDDLQRYTLREARKLLRQTLRSDAYAWLESARVVYRELPFIYRAEQRTIHGVLDVLFQRPDGSWAVLDYKTSAVQGYRAGGDRRLVEDHARRYHLQVGIYAAAAQAQIGLDQPPDAYIHYIRAGLTIHVPEADWRTALDRLEQSIGQLLTD
jgi:ATP-dependent helicase/nuclease subunit A